MLLLTVPARVRRDLSAVGKMPEKSRSQKLQLYFPGTIPRHGEALPCSAPPGVLPAYPLTFLWGKLPAAGDLRFRSKLKLHFQKRISTHKNSTCEKNRQLRNNFWEVTATSNYPATTFRAKATTLLQNEANARPKPFLWHKKIFML